MDVPKGIQFKNVTRLFEAASQEMEIDELLMVEGFTLYEAMSAVEIGDPRMDSGAALPSGEQQPDFDPLTPLLPEEACWILDRSMACEMHWHAGNALAQTVYTCLYMHNLSTINHDLIHPRAMAAFIDKRLPVQLISLVIRAGTMGMVKCCDLAYRELIKGNVHDCEDWQGEKSDTSLLESMIPQRVIGFLEEAELWLTLDEVRDLPFREELLVRIRLRKTLVRLFSLEIPRKMPFVVPLLAEGRRLLATIKQQSVNQPAEGSPAYSAFDPRITRRLHSIMPMRPLTIPPQAEAWRALDGLLDGWELLYQLSSCESLIAWNTVGLFRVGSPKLTLNRLPFTRSLAQSIFSNGSTILDRFPVSWLVDKIFFEVAHIPYGRIVSLFERNFGLSSNLFEEFHGTLTRLLVQHIWASYHNRPRQRRHSMKTHFDWHGLYDSTLAMTARVTPRDSSDSKVLKCISLAILHWRAGIVRDIILSGFELELYADDERPFAYWYLSEVLGSHEAVLRELLSAVPEDTPAHNHLLVQMHYITSLKEMSLGCFTVLCRSSKFDVTRRWTNFTVRYKWALRRKFADIVTPDPFVPDYHAYLRQEKSMLSDDQNERQQKASQLFDNALLRFVQLGVLVDKDIALQLCRVEFMQHHLAGLMLVCENLKAHLSTATSSGSASPTSDLTNFVWDLDVCPWFPQAKSASSSSSSSSSSELRS